MKNWGLGVLVFLVCLVVFVSPASALDDMNKDGRVDVRDLILSQNPKIIMGDATSDGNVNIFDLATVGLAYGSRPGDSNWNPNADVANTVDKIDIFDLATVGLNYNKAYEPDPDIDPIFSVSPAYSDLRVGQNGTTDITIQTLPPEAQVYAAELKVYFDPAILKAEAASEGGFLKQGGAQTFPVINIDNTNGVISFASTRFGVANGASGSGTFLTIIFSGKAAGNSNINIDNILVSDPNLQAITNITANNGSANVVVSDPPVINSVSDDSSAASPTNVGDDVTLTVGWTDPDSTQARFYACDSSNIDPSGCHSREFCSTSNSAANPQTCSYTAQQTDASEEQYWVKVCDNLNVCSALSGPHTFNVNHAPVIALPESAETNEDTAPPANWIDLWAHTQDQEDSDSTLAFALTGQTNPALISCSLSGNRHINCGTPAQDQSGFSDVTVQAKDPHGLSGQDTLRVTVKPINDLPTRPGVDVTPDSPITTNDLACTITNPSTDADGDPITYSYAWFKGGVLQPGLTTNTVPAANTARGETWRCEVTPNDGTGDGPSGQDQATVRNSAPTIDSFSPPADPTIDEGDNQAFSITKSDVDGDPLTTKWYLDGTEAGTGDSYTYNTNYDSQGTHEVRAMVSDGQLTAEHVWQLTVEDTCTRIQLTEGNNMFSLPRNQQKAFSQISNGCTVEKKDGAPILAYYEPDTVDITNLSNYRYIGLADILYPGQGYFVKVQSDCYIEMCDGAVQAGDLGYLGTKQLNEGWNIVGAPTYQTNFNSGTCQLFGGIGILKYGYNVNSCQDVPGWNNKYEHCDIQGGIKRCRCSVGYYEPGLGYWLRTKNDCALT